jgi:hypothetical protein
VVSPRPEDDPGTDARMRVRAALTEAMRTRDTTAVSALRSVLSAIGNAGAVNPPPGAAGAGSPHIAGAVAGLGAGEARRRNLSAAAVGEIVQADRQAECRITVIAGPSAALRSASGWSDRLSLSGQRAHIPGSDENYPLILDITPPKPGTSGVPAAGLPSARRRRKRQAGRAPYKRPGACLQRGAAMRGLEELRHK